ncbi:hypothetical protein WICANDRAFT_61932 [Wickerhamomyces anomalus NRRL Y-366-8]|uniref:Exosome complex protein n=1 Tax=Wickerhamomyces anomalus (strain ATCC 58044 / CBS 1984 / NCYC 433 / NRRL Y-366-8) TaxID=683960 RepID=A0A1E3P7I3_WICAA|nr:uncharacterized protein WICANDRAFT_61932 [Wickerhamomyces anomalus NRRL Y-366-8]ODQ61376.1 hypothetical protein WICANDRAFT_61932 [Wickerhamomyces anomalus NRRL Y-366-8]
MENTELVKQYIDALDVSLDEIEPIIKEISSKSFEDRINETSDEHEKIKISNSYAYLLTSLSFAFLKSKGIDTTNHPIMKDLARVKSYMNRAKEALNPSKEKKVDTGVAKRFIEAALNSGTGNSTVVTGTPEPAISSASFQGKHTKFKDENEKSDDESDDKKVSKKDEASIRKSSKEKLGKKDSGKNKVKKPKKEKSKSTK